jgi:peptidoglycan/LPS O-acetylase OafA/YrhL
MLHRNKFGALRLFFAACVLVSHSFELVTGDRSREPLASLFGTVSLGDIGVDGFFLISGYLITQSFDRSTSFSSYLWKRILRIYPGYVVAFFISLLIVGPFSGADLSYLAHLGMIKQIIRCALLDMPWLPNAFADLHYPLLNGSMWTIAYEFRCYLLIGILGLPILYFRKAVLIGTAILLAMSLIRFDEQFSLPYFGLLSENIRLTAIFLCGSVFYVFRKEIVYRPSYAMIAAAVLTAAMFSQNTATLAVPTLGAYCLFWFAFSPTASWLNNVGHKNDISYGVYLYAWPIQNLSIKYLPGITPWGVLAISAAVSCVLGWASWVLIERRWKYGITKPAMVFSERYTPRSY